jgi:primosomal protein N' (replication factor Y) (superfamily II helicase)
LLPLAYTPPVPTLFPQPATVGFAHVAVERALDEYPDGLTYAVPGSMADLQPGERVVVPLGRGDRLTHGYVIELTPRVEIDLNRVKSIERRERQEAKLPAQLLELARWISGYYCCPIGMTLASMMPAAVKRSTGLVTHRLVDFGEPLPLGEKLPPKQRRVLDVLAALPESQRPIEVRKLAALAELATPASINKLLQRGVLEQTRRTSIEADWARQTLDPRRPAALTPDQQAAFDAIAATLDGGFSTHLLFGVTGSGKTEVYIRLIEQAVARGRTALLLVPEISLTPQTGGRLMGRFPRRHVAVLHSGLTPAQRHQQWAMVAGGEADIVLGARSGVFAPFPEERLGLIIVDEEHDGSYKQDQAPRYHGRDVAIRRAQVANCPVVLGSATPSLESWHNATAKGAYALHRLPRRVPGLRLPTVEIVDFIAERKRHRDKRIHLIGPTMLDAIRRTFEMGGQVLLLLNRRGYGNYIACPDPMCGWVMTCDFCDVTMVHHVNRTLPSGGYVRCHHCLAEQKLPAACPQCSNRIVTFGLGTQRVEEELQRMFPGLVEGRNMLRVDSDAMHGAADFHTALERFGTGEIKLLLGTQMIAKGLDFPGVRLVGVVNADTSINLPDFRAAERTFQLVNQVAGRCGRGDESGRVIVQSFAPETAAIKLAAAHDYEAFAALELAQREASGLPPLGRMVRIVVRDEDLAACVTAARGLSQRLRELADDSIRFRGPAPCPIARIAGRHRQQIEMLAPAAMPLQRLLADARNAGVLKPGEAVAVDVDPIALM